MTLVCCLSMNSLDFFADSLIRINKIITINFGQIFIVLNHDALSSIYLLDEYLASMVATL